MIVDDIRKVFDDTKTVYVANNDNKFIYKGSLSKCDDKSVLISEVVRVEIILGALVIRV